EVPCRRNHDDPLIDETLGGKRERVRPVRLADARTRRHVYDFDVVRLRVAANPVERGDDVADRSLAILVEDLQRNKIRIRGNAGLLAIRVETIAQDDASDMRSMTVVVVWLRLAVDEVDEGAHALIAMCVTAAE